MKQFILDLFGKLQLWQKFLVLAIIATVLTLIPSYFYVSSMQSNIAVAKNEINGIKPSLALQKVVQLTQQHRDLSSGLLNGDQGQTDSLEAKQKEIGNAIAEMDSLVKERISDESITSDWSAAQQQWLTLADQVKKSQINVTQSINAHSDLITDYFSLLDKISDIFELSLDPASDSYFMMRASLYAMPKLIEELSRTQYVGANLLAQKKADAAQVSTLTSFIGLSKSSQEESNNQIQKTYKINPEVKANMESVSQKAFTLATNAVKLAESEIANKQEYSYDKKAFIDEFTNAIKVVIDLNNKSVAELQGIIEARKNNYTGQLTTVLSILGVLFVSAGLIAFFITNSINSPVTHLVGVMQKLASGDTKVRANMQTFDEIGLLGRQFDMMVDQRELMNNQIQQENETLNNSIIEMLQAVGTIAQRDLTVKAPVAEDITGPLGDALNYLTTETANVLNKVVKIAGEVSDVSRQIKSQSDNVITIAEEERREVSQSAAELNVASEEMQNIAKLAVSCNDAAAKAIKNTDKAQDTVLGTVQGITSIRDTIRETEKRIKRLGERSQEIGSVVTIINGIAERTHILALNASMHAASAGEAGRGFAVVANEVQKLAENAREATQQISSLVNNIQVETADTVTNMNDAISQVVNGTNLAQQAGNEMRETRDTTAELVLLVQRIADVAKEQSATSQKLRERAIQIQKTTEQTFQQLQEQGKQTDRLVDFSGNLVQSVGVFKLPA